MYDPDANYTHQVVDISALRTNLMKAENDLEIEGQGPVQTGHSVTAYIGALAAPTDAYGTYAVVGATVTIDGKSAVTDNEGKFTIEGLADGTYEATVDYKYGFTRTFTVVVAGADVLSDVKVGIVGCNLNGDTMVTTADYAIYARSVGTAIGESGYDVGIDFNRDNMITTADYALYARFVGNSSADIAYTDTVIK